jgi:PKHD-type hydroxylase
MLIRIPDVLDANLVRQLRQRLDAAGDAWVDGRATAGHQGAPVKRNLQIAALPSCIYPPMFNRYDAENEMHFGRHVDGAVRLLPGTGIKMRTDMSATLFLSPPEDYEGGELLIEDTYGMHRVKLPAGDLVLYPASTVHRVTPVTRGTRIASFFWVQSMVRDDAQRRLLFDLDMAIVRLSQDASGHESLVSLTGTYHNLLRMWAAP